MDKIIKIAFSLVGIIGVIFLAIFFSGILAHPSTVGSNTIYFFYGEECPHCHNIMSFVINLSKKYPSADIHLLEIWHNQTNNQTYTEANLFAGITPPGVPEVVLGKTVLLGDREIPDKLETLVQDYVKKKN